MADFYDGTRRSDRSGRHKPFRLAWGRFFLGLSAGCVVYVVIALLVFSQEPAAAMPGDLRPFEYLVFAIVATVVLLIAGGLLTLPLRARPVGQGLLVSVAIGLIGTSGGCAAVTYL